MPPLAIVAGIGAAASIGGAVLSSSAQKKAANKASDTAQNTANQNNALTRDIYNQNRGALAPFMNTGIGATGMINELLGIGGTAQTSGQAVVAPQDNALAPYAGDSYGGADPTYGGKVNPRVPLHLQEGGVEAWQQSQPQMQPQVQQQYGQPVPAGTVTASPSAKSAFDRYRESTGYQFRLGEGQNAINTGYAAKGLLESGAAQKALLRYGQDFGSGEFGNYLGALQGQQSLGASSASALAGVGQNYAGMVTANNNNAGSAVANAALIRGQATGNMYGGIANALGGLASSFGQPKPQSMYLSPVGLPYGGSVGGGWG